MILLLLQTCLPKYYLLRPSLKSMYMVQSLTQVNNNNTCIILFSTQPLTNFVITEWIGGDRKLSRLVFPCLYQNLEIYSAWICFFKSVIFDGKELWLHANPRPKQREWVLKNCAVSKFRGQEDFLCIAPSGWDIQKWQRQYKGIMFCREEHCLEAAQFCH